MIRVLILSLAALVFFADPAAADPISGLIAAGKAFFATKLGAIIAQVAISSGLSLLAQRLRKKPKQPGLQNQFKGRGGTEPGSFVLGRAAVKGHQTYHNSQGDNSKWYHEVIELCDLPGATLERLIIDGEYSAIGDVYVDGSAGDVGNIIVAKNKDSDSHRAFIRTYDGTQTSADALLVSHFASDDRRWTTDHKLTGICYAVLSYYFDRKRFSRGVPELSFEMLGIPVYDPRKDTSVGGSGAHRWADPSTWEQSENLIVLVYNILRGIAAPGGAVWGGDCEHEDLPMANWVAAMNACDIDLGGRKKYTGGIEVRWTDAPADIIDQLLAGCNGQITELGGVYRVQVDAPATAVVSVTDDDFIVSDPSEMDPFPGLEGTFNGGTVVHPDPDQLWNASQPHTVTNPSLETQDGTQRLFDLQLPVVHNTAQAKQVLNAAVNDGRRFRKHKGTLPPDLFWLDTLSTFAWTSEVEGYTAKLFEISETAYDLLTFNTLRSIRERDPSDFPIVPGLELAGLPTAITPIPRPDAGVPDFDIVPVTVDDGNGNRRITFKLIWTAAAIEDTVDGISYQLRLSATEETVLTGDIADVSEGQAFLPGSYIPGASYDARGKAISRVRETDWTNWITEIAPAVSDGVRIVQLTTGVQVFTYNAAGASPAPATTVFTATPRGAGGTPYYQFFVDDVSQGAPSTTATFTYTPKASAANMPDVVRVEMRDGGATEPVVASDRITVIGLVPGEAGVAMILTNEAHTVPAAPDGSGEDLAGAFTDVQVYVGAQLDTANWTISRVNSTGVVSSLSGNRITVTDLNVDAGYVDITASRSGFSSITKRFTLTKTRQGSNGTPGANGVDGNSIAQLVIYRRAVAPPETPTGGSFDFDTKVLTPPSGWSVTPPVGTDTLYSSLTAASIEGTTGVDDALTWSTPFASGVDGVSGKSTYQAVVFRRAASTPSTPTGGSFNFETEVLTPPSGWSVTPPEGADPLYAARYLFAISGDTGTATAGTWSSPAIFVRDGADGVSTFQVSVYRRASSTPSTPVGGSYNFDTQAITPPSGWSATIPAGNDPIYISTALASIQGTTGIDSTLTWSAVRELARNGAPGVNGVDGQSVAQLMIFRRSAAPLATPTGGSFQFGENILTPPTGWSLSPPAGGDPLYTSLASASIEGNVGFDSSLTWSDPAVMAVDGDDGTAGRSTYQAAVYRRSSSQPPTPSGGSFNFRTNTLTPPIGWSLDVPSGIDPVWVVRELFSVIGDTGTDFAGTWSTPIKLAENGTDGTDGRSTYLVSIYRRSSSQPATPSGGSYNFGSQQTIAPSGWQKSVPANNGSPLYVSTALASVIGTSGTDSTLTWTFPQIMARDGEDGAPGTPGSPGSDGARGPGRWYIGVSSLPSASLADNRWNDGTGNQPKRPVVGDQAIFYTGTVTNQTSNRAFVCTAVFSDTSHIWAQQVEFFNGAVVIAGTLTLDRLAFFQGPTIEVSNGNLFVRNGGIDTLQVKDDAITDYFYTFDAYWQAGGSGWQTVLFINPWPDPQSNPFEISVNFSLDQLFSYGGATSTRWRLRYGDPPVTIYQIEDPSNQWHNDDSWHSASVVLPNPGSGGKRIALDLFVETFPRPIIRNLYLSAKRVKK